MVPDTVGIEFKYKSRAFEVSGITYDLDESIEQALLKFREVLVDHKDIIPGADLLQKLSLE